LGVLLRVARRFDRLAFDLQQRAALHFALALSLDPPQQPAFSARHSVVCLYDLTPSFFVIVRLLRSRRACVIRFAAMTAISVASALICRFEPFAAAVCKMQSAQKTQRVWILRLIGWPKVSIRMLTFGLRHQIIDWLLDKEGGDVPRAPSLRPALIGRPQCACRSRCRNVRPLIDLAQRPSLSAHIAAISLPRRSTRECGARDMSLPYFSADQSTIWLKSVQCHCSSKREQQFFPVELSVLESTDLLGAIGAARFKSL
jgi:hypothetical protein